MTVITFTLCEVTNPHENFKKYIEASAQLMAKHGGRYIVRGKPEPGAAPVFEGKFLIGIEFPDEAAHQGFKTDYAAIGYLREGSGTYHHAVFAPPAG